MPRSASVAESSSSASRKPAPSLALRIDTASVVPLEPVAPPPTLPPEPPSVVSDAPMCESPIDMVDQVKKKLEERKAVWERRLRILYEAVQAHKDNGDLVENVVYLEALQQRPGVHLGPDPDGNEASILDVYRDVAASQQTEKDALTAMLDSMVDSLVSENATPTENTEDPSQAVPAQPEKDDGAQAQYSEMMKYVDLLKGHAGLMSELLKDYGLEEKAPEKGEPEPEEDNANGGDDEGMDIDASRKRKRKRPKEMKAELDVPADPTLVNKALAADEALLKLYNHIDEQEERMRDAILDAIDLRLQDDLKAYEERTETPGDVDMDANTNSKAKVPDSMDEVQAKMDSEIHRANKDLDDVGGFLQNWSSMMNSIEATYPPAPLIESYRQAQDRRSSTNDRLAQLLSQQDDLDRSVTALRNTASALTAAATANAEDMGQQGEQEASEIVTRAIEDHLKQSLREGLAGVIEDFRKDVEKRWESEAGQLYSDVWDKGNKLATVLDSIEAKLASNEKRTIS